MTARAAADGVETVGPELRGWFTAVAKHLRPGENVPASLERVGRKRAGFGSWRLAWDRPAPTILRDFDPWVWGILHPDEDRFISADFQRRLFSFPDEFAFQGDFKARWAACGNCVPPLLMAAVADVVGRTVR